MTLEKLLKGKQTVAVLCNQWGDSGKGKIVEYIASEWADMIARGTGGANAGHTVVVNGKEMIFHLLPSGIIHDNQGKISILGNGMVIDVAALCNELQELEKAGKTYNHLRISKDAHVVLPYHVAEDRMKNQSQRQGGIGTTGRGIGPCYADKVARRGVTMGDLLDRDALAEKIKKLGGLYTHVVTPGAADYIIDRLLQYAEKLKPFIGDTVNELQEARRKGKKILLEGAQGLLLSIEHGTYPYVTSSDCSLNGTATGVGLCAKDVDLSLGLMKFPFMTRVGAGPFPTELGGKKVEAYCGKDGLTKETELTRYNIPFTKADGSIHYDPHHQTIVAMMNDQDPFIQGVGIRLAAGEYGATTGRPRRIGWTDGVLGRYAADINRSVLVLTKPDAGANLRQFKLCFSYLHEGASTVDFNKEERFLRAVRPTERTYEGYGDIRDVRTYERLPESLRNAINDLELFTRSHVAIVSVGPEREQTIVK